MTLARTWAAVAVASLVVLWAGPATADLLSITANPDHATAGVTITFRVSPRLTVEGDSLVFDFGNGTYATLAYEWGCGLVGGCDQIQHAYAGAGTFTVTASGKAGGREVNGTTQVVISAPPTTAEAYVATGAHAPGYNGTTWRTDLEVHNPSEQTVSYTVALLPRDLDNGHPRTVDLTLMGGRSAHHGDALFGLFAFTGVAALKVASATAGLVVTSRTYNQLPAGSFGQFVPGLTAAQATHSGQEARLTGLSHSQSTSSGFRTNLGLLSLVPAPITVELTFYTRIGGLRGHKSYELKPFELKQINKAYEEVTTDAVDFGYVTARTTTVGGAFLAYASVVENVTGDPIYVPATVLGQAAP